MIDGQVLGFLGPSGCGKTTTLRLIAGLSDVSQGHILVDGSDVTDVPVYQRNIGVVFQNYAPFPHLNVFENVAFGLRRRKQPERVIRDKVYEVLRLVQLEPLAKRYARQLSGGQQRSEEHTSELQSLMRISYAVFCLKKKTSTINKEPQ